MPDTVFLPSLSHWEYGNFWSGSRDGLRFYITVSQGENGREMLAELWDSDVCRELADIIASRSFPCTRQGLDEMREYLETFPEVSPARRGPAGD